MYRTFNCGLGMVLAVPAESADLALGSLAETGEQAFVIGEIIAGDRTLVLS